MEALFVWAPPFLIGELRRATDDQISFQYTAIFFRLYQHC